MTIIPHILLSIINFNICIIIDYYAESTFFVKIPDRYHLKWQMDLLSVDREAWLEDVVNIRDFYAFVGDSVPAELHKELNQLEARLKA